MTETGDDTNNNGIYNDANLSLSATGDQSLTSQQQNIRVFKLKIMLNTNIPGMANPTPFQFSMLSHPDLEKGRFSATKYTLPYFTDTVKYPMDMLTPKLYSDRVDFFFNKTRFNKILRKTMVNYVEDSPDDVDDTDESTDAQKKLEEERARQLQENADHNIKCMLILLFPIADELGNVFKTSYDQFILNNPSPELYTLRNIDPVTFLNPSWLPLYNYFTERVYTAPINEISYLKVNGTQYIVADVIWQNDLINHPIYREFVSVYYDKLQEKRNNRQKINKEFKERKEMFKTLIGKYIKFDTKSNPAKSVFEVMIDTLKQNVSGEQPEREPNKKYEIAPVSGTNFNQRENTKRDVITKMINYLGSMADILHGYKGELSGKSDKEAEITIDNISRELRGLDKEYLLDKIVDNIINAYIDYTNYNEQANGALKLTLKDTTRILTELYNVAILLKTVKLLTDFVSDKIRRLDLSEKNDDGSKKTKLELDMLRVMKTNYTYYIDLNTAIATSLKNVVEPARRSPNTKLQSFLKQLAIPGQSVPEDPAMLIDIYDKYISSIRTRVKREYIEKYMNVGVSNVQSASKDKSDAMFSGEMPEIYVYINVVKKDVYEKTDNRRCIMNDDRITNNLKQVLYSNTMLDNSFPELSAYRDYQFLSNAALETPTMEKTKSDKQRQPDKPQKEKLPKEDADKQNKNKNQNNKDKEDDLDDMEGGRIQHPTRWTHKYRNYRNRHTRKHSH